ncbi:DUF4190 domain-containing protein [Brevibacterium marinum]|uniref:DUF4190 domain-containing protein n=1 Tax=Brevibacterium marinum TaxID=418643 RepID=A0A846S0R1_9MICO|nr:hypothetical protein [Brevibacterium marinum]
MKNVSENPNYRPSDPPQVGSQQFNNGYGSPQPQNGYGSGQYPDQNQYPSQGQYADPNQFPQVQPGSANYGQANAYGNGQPDAYGQPGGYSQAGEYGYSQPGASDYGQSGGYSQPGAYDYGQSGAYSYGQPMSYGAPMGMMRPKANSLSVWAMWMGIIGLGGGFVCSILSMIPVIGILFSIVLMFLWVAPILAVIFGHIARGQIDRTGEDGHSQATAGLIMGYVSIGLGLLAVVVIVGVVGLGVFAAGMGY